MKKIGFKKNKLVVIKQPISQCSFTHSLILGKTGTGKTSSALLPAIKQRISDNHSVLCFDEKNSMHLHIKNMAKDLRFSYDNVYQFGTPEGLQVNIVDQLSQKRWKELANNLIKGTDDPYWSNAARLMLVNVALYMKALKEFMSVLKQYSASSGEFEHIGYYARHNKTNEAGFSWIDTHEKDATFHEFLVKIDDTPLVFNDVAVLFEDAKLFIVYCVNAEKILSKITENMNIENNARIHEKYKEVCDRAHKLARYSIKPELSEASGNNGVFFMVSSSIIGLTADFLNQKHGVDINQLLENGQNIVVVNTEALDVSITSSLLGIILSRFVPRAKLKKKRPVSVVIDEAYRVFSNDGSNDLYTDILREAMVDITVSTQNEHQMIEKFGVVRWLSFQQNFVNRVSYRNDSNGLETFEYQDLDTQKTYKATPIFFNHDELMCTELEYQNTQNKYLNCRDMSCEVVIYDHSLMENSNQVIIYNVKTGIESFRKFNSDDNETFKCVLNIKRKKASL